MLFCIYDFLKFVSRLTRSQVLLNELKYVLEIACCRGRRSSRLAKDKNGEYV
jgi:hypothetical protein